MDTDDQDAPPAAPHRSGISLVAIFFFLLMVVFAATVGGFLLQR